MSALFWSSAALFAAHQLGQKVLGLSIPWADNYLDPLLCMPILLTLLEWERRFIWGAGPLRLHEIMIATGLLSVLFECGFPAWSARFTADIWDVAAYFAGAGAYAANFSYLAANSKFRYFFSDAKPSHHRR
jgi:hypothetical protein